VLVVLVCVLSHWPVCALLHIVVLNQRVRAERDREREKEKRLKRLGKRLESGDGRLES
jgi:hypothetical protein